MTKDRIGLTVAIGRVAGVRARDRVPKAAQRQVASACRALLQAHLPGLSSANMSVSHSRAWVAVASTARGDALEIGVDIECADPARDWSRIVRYLSPDIQQSITQDHGALIWTAYEAVFKATGVWPTSAQIAAFTTACAPLLHASYLFSYKCGDTYVLSARLPQDDQFAFSVAIGCPRGVDLDVSIEWLELRAANI